MQMHADFFAADTLKDLIRLYTEPQPSAWVQEVMIKGTEQAIFAQLQQVGIDAGRTLGRRHVATVVLLQMLRAPDVFGSFHEYEVRKELKKYGNFKIDEGSTITEAINVCHTLRARIAGFKTN